MCFDLFAKITLDTGEYERKLDKAGEKTASFGDKLKSGLANATKVAAAGIAAATAAASAFTAATVKGVSEIAEYGDNIDKMSQKMGLSAQAYQEWDAIMQHSGTSIESLQAGMKTLANAVENGNGAFERLGITQQEIASMNNEELFSATISALQNVENETERTYLAGQLLGRGATELGALLNTSAEETEAMRQRVHELGGVMSDEAVKNAAKFQDSLQDMQTAVAGLGRGILADLMPGLTSLMDGFSHLITGEDDAGDLIKGGVESIADSIKNSIGGISAAAQTIIPVIVSTITETLPIMGGLGGEILTVLVDAIVENLPSIVSAGATLLVQLVNGLTSALPKLISAVPSIISALVGAFSESLPELLESGKELLDFLTNGILDAIPDMIAKLPEVIDSILRFITSKLPGFLDKGMELLEKFAFGIIEYIPQLVAQLPAIIRSITEFITQNFPLILEKGGELLGKLLAGILGAIPEIAVQLPAVIDAIVDALKAGWQMLVEAGSYLLEGLWNGISDKIGWLKSKVTGVVDTIKGWFTGSSGFDEHSPSKWANQVFRYIMEGGGEGLEAGLPSLMQDVDSVVSRVKNGMDFGTANVDFAASGIGQSSAAIINSAGGGDERNVPVIPLTINLLTGEARPFAEWILSDLISVANARGTPIAGQQYA